MQVNMLEVGKTYKMFGQFNRGYTVKAKLLHINMPLKLLTFKVLSEKTEMESFLGKERIFIVSTEHIGLIAPQDD